MWGKLVKEGISKYNGADLKIWITLHDIAYGSGDHEETKEIQNDKEVPTYYLWIEPAGGGQPQGAGQFSSLNEAVDHIEKILPLGKPTWNPS